MKFNSFLICHLHTHTPTPSLSCWLPALKSRHLSVVTCAFVYNLGSTMMCDRPSHQSDFHSFLSTQTLSLTAAIATLTLCPAFKPGSGENGVFLLRPQSWEPVTVAHWAHMTSADSEQFPSSDPLDRTLGLSRAAWATLEKPLEGRRRSFGPAGDAGRVKPRALYLRLPLRAADRLPQ